MTSFSKTLSIFIFFQAACAIATSPRLDLFRRQTSPSVPPLDQLPPQCRNACSAPIATIQSCNPPQPSCTCTTSFELGLFDCYTCLGQAVNATDFSVPQQVIDRLTQACDQAGSPLPTLTFPGQATSRSLSTTPSITSTGITPPATSTQPQVTQTVPTSLPTSSSPSTLSVGVTPTVTTGGNSTGSGNGAHKREVNAGLCMGAVAVGYFFML
ncbi:hypothetical protein BU17DRAFT_101470 [Hysterangium stoloniferum]|nr:hypothetical protein BU17DRAFT_101470 [Hysterangium stoloniferum]